MYLPFGPHGAYRASMSWMPLMSTMHNGTIMHLNVTNNTTESVNLKLRMDSMVNADNNGDDDEWYIQFCFGELCYNEVAVDNAVPAGLTGKTLAPGESNHPNDKFQSWYPGDTEGQIVEYNMQLIQLDDAGNTIDVVREFTFRYNPTASVDDLAGLQNMGITVKNTVVSNMLELDSAHNATLQLFDITGKQVKEASIAEGVQAIDLSALNAAVYIAKFTTTENKTAQVRIVKN